MKHFTHFGSFEADFGKVNLKNLQKLQALDVKTPRGIFLKKSRVPSEHPVYTDNEMMLHDGISHLKIKPSLGKYLPKVDYKTPPRDFLHLNPNPKHENNSDYNNGIEAIAAGIEGKGRKSNNPLVHLGNSIRKRDLTPVEKLATSWEMYPEITRIKNKKDAVTQEDVNSLIDVFKETKPSYMGKDRGLRKVKGIKPPEKDLEYKKAILEGKYFPEE